MWKQIAVTGGVAAALFGLGTAAYAATGTSPTPGASTPSGSAAAHPAHPARHGARADHAQWVTGTKGGPFTTHDAIRGTVTAVSPTSVTVTAADGVAQTYAVTGSTTVRVAGQPGAIGQVHTGDPAVVSGTGTTTLTAAHVLDRPVHRAHRGATTAPGGASGGASAAPSGGAPSTPSTPSSPSTTAS